MPAARLGSERLADFQVIKRLGKGAFGDVFKVKRKSDGNYYALKKVNISSMSTREVQDALNEIRFLASVKHPNVVGFLEAFLNEKSLDLCIVMEYADGGDLAGKVEKYKQSRQYMSENTIWGYFLQIMEGVICFHDKKILHRDLKTANIFLTMDGKVKIGDLNVSKLARMGLVKTQIGTPYYMSPEIWQNRPYNDKSDIWSIGCILYELCALRPPFRGADLEDLAKRVQAGYYPRIPSRYSSDLDQTIRAMLQLDPRRRPNAKQVMQLPQVKKRMAEFRKLLNETLISALAVEDDGNLLATIQVPRNVRRITNALPKPQYPDTRPHSPKQWPVSADGRAEAIARAAAKAAGGLDAISEAGGDTAHSGPARLPGGAHGHMDPRSGAGLAAAAAAHESASSSDPMLRGRSGADARAQARAVVAPSAGYGHHKRNDRASRYGGGGGGGYNHHNHHRNGGLNAAGDAHSVASRASRHAAAPAPAPAPAPSRYNRNNYGRAAPSGYAANAGGVAHGGIPGGAYQHAAPKVQHKPRYGQPAHLPSVHEHQRPAVPAVRQYGRPAVPVVKHHPAAHGSGSGSGSGGGYHAGHAGRRGSRSSYNSRAAPHRGGRYGMPAAQAAYGGRRGGGGGGGYHQPSHRGYSRATRYSARSAYSQASSKPAWWG